nr:connector enhancer of kinase suppressor of ras 1 isoform X1 [Oryctolagus cuniculus]XP_051712796.1 connector enhancer of kinase suppressor of ras 1 isoform X2 [Oryctolagus cuniculus]XP_051712797.1 connector enhancer of kinase suppressor of ras 1 isoform X3 [Oryctolagus cuniculus]XP_051712798.1 connector enhancer of kinase suppressor of ras 1 isoform X4 [Oryctolagus cuniculus]
MEPVEAWTPGKVAAWLRGLDDCLQDYPFEDWQLPGHYLLQLCPRSLEALTVWPLGHQELILDGVEQLRSLSSGLQSENLQSLTQRLLEGTEAFQSSVQGRLGCCAETPADVLSAAVELVREAQALLCWLNRYLFSQLNDFSACQEIGVLCTELGQVLQEDCPAAERESKVLRICSHVAGICHTILSCSPAELLGQKAVLEQVQLAAPLDLEIHTTSNCLHFVSRVGTQVPTDSRQQILPGDEIIQINEQVVVAWSHKNVLRELLRQPAGVSLVLKKIPVPETPPKTPPQALDSPRLGSQSPTLAPLSPRASPRDAFAFDLTSNPSPGPTPTSTDSTSLDPEPLPIPSEPPATVPAEVAETPGPPGYPDKSPGLGGKKSKGVATRLSRRRVSCRELGRPDCDGWLLLRKTPSGFMGPRWRRCWFVLKGHTLYWYCQPQDEKAEGLINVSNYSLESGHDQKKKYVFQLTHDVYKPFVFAADTLSDLSMWVRHLITCISKYQSPGRPSPAREEDCYSETEAEDPDDEAGSRSASPSPAQSWSPLHRDTSPATTPTQRSPRSSFGPPADSSDGALEGMVQGLRQVGVSLLGQPQPLTHEQWRSSFMRRNRDPQLNERVHRVRALQSTLKAKLQELQALEEVLGDPELTGEKFRRWKEQNQELYSEGLGAWGVTPASVPLPSDPQEHSHLCPLTPDGTL